MTKHRPYGMTLLEMLVVLIIAAMALTLGFQSLGQWRKAEAAISSLTAASRETALTRSWLEASLRGLTPVEDQPFQGDATQLSGTTLQPMNQSQGGAGPVTWRLEQDPDGVWLALAESGTSLRLPLDGIESAEFSYLDPEGKEYSAWPPALGLHDHLPATVTLRLHPTEGHDRLWAATIVGIRNPIPLIYDAEQE